MKFQIISLNKVSVLFSLLAVLTITSCDNDDSSGPLDPNEIARQRLFGTWVNESGTSTLNIVTTYVFNADGSGESRVETAGVLVELDFTWELENETDLTLSQPGTTESITGKVTFVDDNTVNIEIDGSSVLFEKL